MPIRPLTPQNTAPLLPLILAKIARTPAARLAVGYKLECRPSLRPWNALPFEPSWITKACNSQVPPRWLTFIGAQGDPWLAPFERPLGVSLLIDRLIAGGILGTVLPILDSVVCEEATRLGQCVDICA